MDTLLLLALFWPYSSANNIASRSGIAEEHSNRSTATEPMAAVSAVSTDQIGAATLQ